MNILALDLALLFRKIFSAVVSAPSLCCRGHFSAGFGGWGIISRFIGCSHLLPGFFRNLSAPKYRRQFCFRIFGQFSSFAGFRHFGAGLWGMAPAAPVNSCVGRGGNNNKIFRPVIRPITVYMVDMFVFSYWAVHLFCCHQNMFGDITAKTSGVFRLMYHCITGCGNILAAFPSLAETSCFAGFSAFVRTIHRDARTRISLAWIFPKIPFAGITNKLNLWHVGSPSRNYTWKREACQERNGEILCVY